MFHNLKFCVRWKSLVSAVLSSLLLSVNIFVPMFFAPASAQAQPVPPAPPLQVTQVAPARVQAQPVPPARPLQVTQVQLRNASVRLRRIERLFDKVESQKLVTFEDSETVSKATFEYALAMKSALDDALKSAETAARTEGKQDSIDSLDTFEKAEKANEPRLQKIGQRATSIEDRIKRGAILIDKPAIEKLSIMERRDLLNSLEPTASKTYIQKHPDLFTPVLEAPQTELKSFDKMSESQQSFLPKAQNVVRYADRYISMPLSNTLQSISEIIVPPAYAAAAAGCVGLVRSKNWGAAVDCVVKAGPQATSIYNSFLSCWNSVRAPFKWLKQVGCLAKLIIRLG